VSKTYGTVFSDDRRHRFTLRREIGGARGRVVFIGLNPSTADERKDDPTVRRCIGYAAAWNFTELYVLNLFSLRATDPKKLYRAKKPNHKENNTWIDRICQRADLIVCAWGTHGGFLNRDQQVYQILRYCGGTHCLRTTKDGFPSHPLYLPAALKPVRHQPRLAVRPAGGRDCNW
jgi:hypothetical protein